MFADIEVIGQRATSAITGCYSPCDNKIMTTKCWRLTVPDYLSSCCIGRLTMRTEPRVMCALGLLI